MPNYTLGSLFDGSGGFPLAGSLCGVKPIWASEVEPYPIAVTRSRFPEMMHLGSVTYIHGKEIKPVDVVTFGSPCQDLSIAGKRAGLKHADNGDDETTRSGLFMEAVRIIKEMREATNGEYPAFALWENVPGAFNSNKGEDFRTVLEELIKIVEPEAVMPAVPKTGWAYADCYIGDGWSLAYRVFDAQYWGVPQRRRRIYLVLDLRGERAGEVLFERESLRGHFEAGRTTREGTAGNVTGCAGADDCERNCMNPWDVQSRRIFSVDGPWPALYGGEGGGRGYVCYSSGFKEYLPFDAAKAISPQNGSNQKMDEPHHPLTAQGYPQTVICKEEYLFENHSQDSRYKGPLDVCPMLPAQLGTGGNNQPLVVEKLFKHNGSVYCMEHRKANGEICENKNYSMNCDHEQPIVASIDCRNMNERKEPYHTLQAKPNRGQSINLLDSVRVRYNVRRLTPSECARLQGFPDTWGHPEHKEDLTEDEYRFWMDVRNTHAAINDKNVKKYSRAQMLKWYNKLHTDSSEYKMWGNGIALPNALYVMQGIVIELNRELRSTNVDMEDNK